jgi:hypothetical protein
LPKPQRWASHEGGGSDTSGGEDVRGKLGDRLERCLVFFRKWGTSRLSPDYSRIISNLELQSEAGFLSSGSIPWYQSAVVGPGGIAVTFYINFWTPCSKGAAPGCLGQDVINLFQFLDPAETKSFSFDTSFSNTVGAFKNFGFVEHWQDYLDHYHPGQLDLRDGSVFCSAHADIDKGSGQGAGQPTTGTIHLDTLNPWEPSYLPDPIGHWLISKIESKPCS